MTDAIKLAEKIEQTVKGTQFEPMWTDEELLLAAKALRAYVSQPVAWQRGDGFSFISDESKRKYPDRSRDFTIPLCRCEPEQG